MQFLTITSMASPAVKIKQEIVDDGYENNEAMNSDDATAGSADDYPSSSSSRARKVSAPEESSNTISHKRRRVRSDCNTTVNGFFQDNSISKICLGPAHDFTSCEHSNELLKQLNERRKKEQFIDLILEVDGHEISCHKVVLCSVSEYFSGLLVPNTATKYQQRLYISETTSEVMSLLVDYAYTSKITISEKNIEKLVNASKVFKFSSVYNACLNFLKYRITVQNCLQLKSFSEKQGCEELVDWVVSFVHHYIQQIADTDDFFDLTLDEITSFVSSKELNVKQEEVVYEIAMKWIRHDLALRKSDLPHLLEHVRLPLVKPQFLLDVVEQEPLLKNNPDCDKYLVEAKRYQLLPDQRPLMQSSRTRPRASYSAKKSEVLVTVGGLNKEKVPLKDCCYIDFPDPTPKQLAKLEVSQSGYSVAVVNNNVFVSGGAYEKPLNDVWMYVPSLDKWKQVAPMKEARYLHASVGLGGFLYVIGGHNGTRRLKSIEKFNPDTNIWSEFKPMLKALSSPSAVSCEGQIYILGGATGSGNKDIIADVQRYNSESESWSQVAPLPHPERGAVAANLEGKIYVMGKGKSVICYNRTSDKWVKLNSTNGGHLHGAATVHRGHLYVAGGLHGNAYVNGTVEQYDCINDTWHVTATLHAPVYAQGFVSIFKDPSFAS